MDEAARKVCNDLSVPPISYFGQESVSLKNFYSLNLVEYIFKIYFLSFGHTLHIVFFVKQLLYPFAPAKHVLLYVHLCSEAFLPPLPLLPQSCNNMLCWLKKNYSVWYMYSSMTVMRLRDMNRHTTV